MISFWTDESKLAEYIAPTGNRFDGVLKIAKTARYMSDRTSVLHSHALNWIATGEVPKYIQSNRISDEEVISRNLQEDVLSYVTDPRIWNSVVHSIQKSKQLFHLIYVYENSLIDAERARVRILCNMIWNQSRFGSYNV